TMPHIKVVERDYPATAERYSTLGPQLEAHGNEDKGLSWETAGEVAELGAVHGLSEQGRPRIDNAIQACDTVMTLASTTNGAVAMKAWQSLSECTGREHTHLAAPRAGEHITFRDIVAQPRKVITSPIWSGVSSQEVTYNGSYLNVHELIPWRTLT